MAQYKHSNYAEEFRRRSGPYWRNAVAYSRNDGPPPIRPYQVEIHPVLAGSQVCLQRCVDCHGQFHRERGRLMQHHYTTLVEDLAAMGVPSVVISGAYSDPTMDEQLIVELLERGGPRWGVKLHTYGLGLTSAVGKAIIHAALEDPHSQSYVTLSKCAVDEGTYCRLCRPAGTLDSPLRLEDDNLRRFFKEVAQSEARLAVRINCRVTRINGNPHQLARMLQWLDTVPPFVDIRFTTDYMPSSAPEEYQDWFNSHVYVDAVTAQRSIKQAIVDANFWDVARISFRDTEASDYRGDRCYNGLLFASVSATGMVCPCQGVCFTDYDHLAYGDLTVDRFPNVWDKYIRAWPTAEDPIARGCPRCAASCERMINEGIQDATP